MLARPYPAEKYDGANRRVSLTTKWNTRLSVIERLGIASVTPATYPVSPNTIPNLVYHVRKSIRYI
jgi:hypothetical protein